MESGLTAFEEEITESFEQATRAPEVLNSAFKTSLIVVGGRSYQDPTAGKLETWRSFVSAMQLGAAIYATAGSDGDIECRLGDQVRILPSTGGPAHYADAGNWLTALWLSIVCREADRIDMLAGVPTELLRTSGAQFDDYAYLWVDALQTYWTQGPGFGDKLAAAIEGAAPEVARETSREILLKLIYPSMRLFYHFARRQHDEFNDALAEALELHKEFWSSDEERSYDPDGFVALAPLAITCLAHDAGFPVTVESEYVPKHLIERSWVGEFLT